MSTPYASAAPYYARYRPPYPAEFYELLADRFALDGSQTVLDLGAGPGPITLALAPLADQVYAVDPEPAMLAEGSRLAEERGLANTSWLAGDAAGIGRLCLPRIDLCVIGRAFHLMDRSRVAAELDGVLAPRGGIVLVDSVARPGVPRPPWAAVAEEVCARFLGPGRGRAADWDDVDRSGEAEGTVRPRGAEGAEGSEDHLAKSPFSRVETITWDQRLRHTADEVTGLLLSCPACAPARFGDRRAAFESELRQALLDHDPVGTYARTVRVRAVIATRPRP
ncbi:class I SAM-dependent methyltransferase [Streptomyces sp. MB09-01]|uniref:class I SAM-dependent methyltransferase n=1 Tax=Streptomyces sp. MB09-01 TaxID=3028666 RepID=UPI0029A42E77|nr:class I SAM-dependent methyltransferase [Streptomyces sp. MB09-01]MDX3533123.1 class I SAM-dependent methyltransferase [Streptomyces sp. MB09-01]